MTAKTSVLVIDEESQMRRFVRTSLVPNGYRVFEAATAAEGLRHAEAHNPDVVLVDLDLPGVDGAQFVRWVRRLSDAPILAFSARADELATVGALDGGADDVFAKPFGAGELGARIRTALRHATRTFEAPDATLAVGTRIRIDLARRIVLVENKEVHLTRLEYQLLALLAKDADKVLTHQYLLEEVWGPEHGEQLEYLRVYMKALRSKLEKDPAKPRHLVTEVGIGYRLRLS